jgi:pyruvate ferredoxin oxidoreductase beta subunit
MKLKSIENVSQFEPKELLAPGTPACGGCGALLNLRYILKVLGERTVLVSPSGCMTLLVVYPYSPPLCSWLHLAIENAASGAAGLRHGLDVLIEKGKAQDMHVVAYAGDGATYDIGLQALSGALDRKDQIIYFCYDNESFGNTGFQHSSASPYGSFTLTTPPGKKAPLGNVQEKKDIYEIVKAHRTPYVATTCPSYPFDLMKKVKLAAENKPSFIVSITPCPTGWGVDPGATIKLGKLAVETGMWVLKESLNGKERLTYIPRKRKPVEEYLKLQKRFRHLFKPKLQVEAIKTIQAHVDKTWQELEEKGLL